MTKFLLLCLIPVISCGISDNDIRNEIHVEESDFSDNDAFEPPIKTDDLNVTLTSSCTCKSVLVSSLGDAQHIQAGQEKYDL